MGGRLTLALVASLAVNAALLGVVGGRLLGGGKTESANAMQLERYGPTSDTVRAAWDQLPESDRTLLRKELGERWAMMEGERKQLQAAGRVVYEAALADPFDEDRLRDAVTVFQQREYRMQQSAEDILIRHLAHMPPEARATAAVGLLTPFNARMQRVDNENQRRGDDTAPVNPPREPQDEKS